MQEYPRDAVIWDAGYYNGWADREEGRPNLVGERYVLANVVDLREWLLRHGRDLDGKIAN